MLRYITLYLPWLVFYIEWKSVRLELLTSIFLILISQTWGINKMFLNMKNIKLRFEKILRLHMAWYILRLKWMWHLKNRFVRKLAEKELIVILSCDSPIVTVMILKSLEDRCLCQRYYCSILHQVAQDFGWNWQFLFGYHQKTTKNLTFTLMFSRTADCIIP